MLVQPCYMQIDIGRTELARSNFTRFKLSLKNYRKFKVGPFCQAGGTFADLNGE